MYHRYILDVQSIREYEKYLVDKGAELELLMELAGTEVAVRAHRQFAASAYLVLAGPGNNGGDAWICADELAKKGAEVRIVCAQTPEEIQHEYIRERAKAAVKLGLPVFVNPSLEEFDELYRLSDVVIDGIFGIGFYGELAEPYRSWCSYVNEHRYACDKVKPVVSIDVPTGMNAMTGELCESAIQQADVTVTMFAAKPGFIGGRDMGSLGRLCIADIGAPHLPEECEDELAQLALARILPTESYADCLTLPPVDPLAHKYSRGSLLIVAGSSLYPGAALLAARAAEQAGAGYIIVAVPQSIAATIQAQLPSVVVLGLPADQTGAFDREAAVQINKIAEKVDFILAGPGMTTRPGSQAIVRELLALDVPLMLDADALNCLAELTVRSLLDAPQILRREHSLILTPHDGELARLVRSDTPLTPATRLYALRQLIERVGSRNFMILSKGVYSYIAHESGTVLCLSSPEPLLARAGSGDVLAGFMASILTSAFAYFGKTLHQDQKELDLIPYIYTCQYVHNMAAQQISSMKEGLYGYSVSELAASMAVLCNELYACLQYEDFNLLMAGKKPSLEFYEDEDFETVRFKIGEHIFAQLEECFDDESQLYEDGEFDEELVEDKN